MFTEFKAPPATPAFHRIQQLRAVVNGNDELGMWQHKRLDDGASIVKSAGAIPAIVVIVPDGDNFSVTTYWPNCAGASNAILDFARGKITSEQLWNTDRDYDFSWSGGPIHMNVTEAYAWLAVGVLGST
jgi:hypothetical protein